MHTQTDHSYELSAGLAFSKQATVFDSIYGHDCVTNYKRKRVREHITRHLSPSSNILELNCGTGEDAIWLAGQGHRVYATDISEPMLKQLRQKIWNSALDEKIRTEVCSFSSLDNLSQPDQFDFIFSNFAGLNCAQDLQKVLHSFPALLKPGGLVTLVLMPPFCLWETLLLFKGKFKTAFRRFSGKRGTLSRVEGNEFRCWYYSPGYIKKHMRDSFELVSIEGLCSPIPPSYMVDFPTRHPRLYSSLLQKEEHWNRKWPWRNIGDYYIISLRKKPDQ